MKKYKILPHFYFLALVLVSLVFANTIASTGKNAYDIFILLNPTQGLDTNIFSTNFLNSLFCKIALHLGASLQMVAYLWVFLNVLYVYICYLLVSKVFKQPILGFSIILLSLGMYEVFIQQSNMVYRCLLGVIVGISIVVFFINLRNKQGKAKKFAISQSNLFIHCRYAVKGSNCIKALYGLIFLFIWICILRYLPNFSPDLYNAESANLGINIFSDGLSYLVKNSTSIYFFVFLILGYLGVLYLCKKDYIRLVFLLMMPLCFMVFSLPKQGALYYESCFLPLVAVIVFWFSRDVLWAKKSPKFWIYIVVALLLASFSTFIRSALKYQNRNNYFSVIQSAIEKIPAQRIDGRDCELNINRLESSAIPHIEFLLYSSLSKQKPYVFLFPQTPNVDTQNMRLNTKYFPIADTGYFKAPKQFIPYYQVLYTDCGAEILFSEKGSFAFLKSSTHPYSQFFQAFTQTADAAYEGEYSVNVFDKQRYGMEISIPVKPFDKVEISVKRMGSNNGFLVMADKNKKGRGLHFYKGVSTPDSIHEEVNGSVWKTLSLKSIIPMEVNYIVIYVFNEESEPVYFDNLQIRVLRQCTPLEAKKAKEIYLKPTV